MQKEKEYHPHNYSYIQPKQPNTSKLNISNPIVSILPSKKKCQNVEASVDQKREQTRSKIAQKFTISKGVFMQKEKKYHPHNYYYIQPEQLNTSKLNISNQNVSIFPSKEECQNVEASVDQKREQTRSKIATRLLTMFASSVVASFVLVGCSSLIPNSDKGLLKDLIPLVVTPQVVLLGVALGFYFDKD